MWVMYPTFRGSRGDPGPQESFYGEVDDLVAAVALTRTIEGVDTQRVYLGGHGTGGT